MRNWRALRRLTKMVAEKNLKGRMGIEGDGDGGVRDVGRNVGKFKRGLARSEGQFAASSARSI